MLTSALAVFTHPRNMLMYLALCSCLKELQKLDQAIAELAYSASYHNLQHFSFISSSKSEMDKEVIERGFQVSLLLTKFHLALSNCAPLSSYPRSPIFSLLSHLLSILTAILKAARRHYTSSFIHSIIISA